MPSFPTWNTGLAAPGRHPFPRRGMRPKPGAYLYMISGVTRDETGAALGSCVVKLFRKSDDALIATTTSDGVGAYTFGVVDSTATYYVTAYRAGSPAVSGIAVDLTV